MREQLRVAIVGVGNCASSLVQGLEYYKDANPDSFVPGLMHIELGGYRLRQIKPVVGFDIDERKIGKDISEAIYAPPNCTTHFANVPSLDAPVLMGNVLDSVTSYMEDFPPNEKFIVSNKHCVNVVQALRDFAVDIVINYLPVGSEEATQFYAVAALTADCAFINCMPSRIASDETWAERFARKQLPLMGDDIKSQLGGTYLHRLVVQACVDRGIKIEGTYQHNWGGNTDFANMTDPKRNASKSKSKYTSVRSLIPYDIGYFHTGPGDGELDNGYRPEQSDRRIAKIIVKGKGFGEIPLEIMVNLSVEDSPNSAGVVVDAIRCAGVALDRSIGGALSSPSAYFFKHPPQQFPDPVARKLLMEFLENKRER